MNLKQIARIGYTRIFSVDDSKALAFESGLSIDADGSPRAYGPDGKGLDSLANAGHPGQWWGIVTSPGGNPIIQGGDDPAPGYYVSTTSLQDGNYQKNDPRRYVNSEVIPFIVLPPQGKTWGTMLGDCATVVNLANGRAAQAIFADTGPMNHIGEGSIQLAYILGISPNPKTGGAGGGILTIVYPGSGDGKVKEVDEIETLGQTIFEGFGGMDFANEIQRAMEEYAA